MQKITPFLWFDGNAEAAAKFYISVFKKSRIVSVTRYGGAAAKVSGNKKGRVMTVKFKLDGQEFVALNGGPQFKFTEAISFAVDCKNQKEVDYYWNKLSAGGKKSRCGWLKDKFGVSWQIVPTAAIEMISDKDPARSERVMKALFQMDKVDIKLLNQAYKQKP